MVCENCKKKEANVHYTEVFNNKTNEMHFCTACAEKKGIVNNNFSDKGFNIPEILTGLMSNGKPLIKTGEDKRTCKYCGLTFSGFKEAGRLGCSGCYDSFSKELVPIIRRIHGRTQHVGKIPEMRKGEALKQKELSDLKRRLKKLITEEKYEEAAVARDRINVLEEKSVALK